MSGTLREALGARREGAPPRAAWRRLLRQLKAGDLRTRAELERRLDAPVGLDADELDALAADLRSLLSAADAGPVASRIQALLERGFAPTARGDIAVRATGWPPGFGRGARERLLRVPLQGDQRFVASAATAAARIREFDGFVLAGSTLLLEPELDGAVLPPVSRHARVKPQRRGRRGPWLPHVDEAGRRYLTPESLAARQAGRIPAARVLDLFAGCGGNALAGARAGLDVVAVEADEERAGLCRRNAAALGLPLEVHHGAAEDLGPALWRPGTAVFLDPPWERGEATWGSLLSEPLRRWLGGVGPLVLKAPREFDVCSLPARGWVVHYEFGDGEDDRAVVRMLTIVTASTGSP